MHAMLLMFVLAQPPWSNDVEVRFKVADESGCPVSNAVVRVFTRRDLIPSFSHGGDPQRTVEAMTDANGIAEVKFPCYSSVFNCDVKANGYYYEKMMDVVFKHSSKGAIFSEHLLEHSKKIDFVLRRVLCPVPGYGYGAIDCISYPQPTGKFGFDMEVGEWLPPHGRGKCADFWIVSETSMEPTGELRRVGVEFVGAYNGAYKSKKKKATTFKSDYTVDVAKNFSPRILLWSKLITGKEYSIWRFVSDDEYLVIRSRSVVSPRGELLSCNYSKIYGPISCGGALCFEEMFFNPKVNDRNLEFDPQHNLKKKIVSGFVRP